MKGAPTPRKCSGNDDPTCMYDVSVDFSFDAVFSLPSLSAANLICSFVLTGVPVTRLLHVAPGGSSTCILNVPPEIGVPNLVAVVKP